MSKIKYVKDYRLIKCIGKGSFGEVYLTKKEKDPNSYATKVMEISKINLQEMNKYILNEIKIMKELKDNENIIHLHDLIRTKNNLYIIMDYCNGGSLNEILNNYKLKYGKPFSQEIVQYFMSQILKGLIYVHSKKIIHRDLKLDNILLNFENIEDKKNLNLLASKVKIIDFGLATVDKGQTIAGSPLYMDPLILKKYNKAGGQEKLQEYDEKADIWSLGAICYQLVVGETLFNVNNMKLLLEKVEKGDYSIPIYYDFSKELISFLNSMLQYEGEKRLSAEQLYNHPFISKNVKDFTKADYKKISYKINNGLLTINIKENKTIWLLFNEDVIKQKSGDTNNKIIEANNNPSNNIVNINEIKQKKINILKGCEIMSNEKNRFIEGYASPRSSRIRKNIGFKNKEKEKKEMENIKKSIQIMEEQDQKKNENIIIDKKGIDIKDNDQKLKEWNYYIQGLLAEYLAAKKYFAENDLKVQEENSNIEILKIQNIKSQYELGYSIYLKDLPKPISPEYIYGYSNTERNNKFKEVINKYVKDKNNLIYKMNSQNYIISLKIKEKYEKYKKKLDNLTYIIKKLERRFNNVWAPAPLYTKEYLPYPVEKISYDNCIFQLKIKMKRIDNKNEDINFIISLIINERKKLINNIQLKNIDSNYEECLWSMNYSEWTNVDINVENFLFAVEKEKNLSNIPYKATINIGRVKKGKSISFNVKIPTENKDMAIINFIASPIIPKGKKYIENEMRQFLIIKKVYSAFEGKSPFTSNSPKLS